MLTSLHLMAGGGGDIRGFHEAGYTPVAGANHAPVCIETLRANWPDADWRCADVDDMPMDNLPPHDVQSSSPICFPAGTTVITKRGVIPIESVEFGDEVLTHLARWRPVTKVMTNVSDTVVVRGHGHNALETTAEHPFYARATEKVRIRGTYYKRLPVEKREWVEAKNLESLLWATPLTFGEKLAVPPVPGRGVAFTEAFWWMVGRWLGDGFVSFKQRNGCTQGEVYICCGDLEADGLEPILKAIDPPVGLRVKGTELRWTRRKAQTATNFVATHTTFAQWLVEHFGRHAHGKRVPAWLLTMPRADRSAFLAGYMSADGNVQFGRARFSSVSRPLAVGIRLLAVSLGYVATLNAPSKRTAGVIEGRPVKMRPLWAAGWQIDPNPLHSQTFDEGPHRWSKVRSVRPGREQVEVFNLEVADDESYIADGIVVHNCTEISQNGGRKRHHGQLSIDPAENRENEAKFRRTRVTAYGIMRCAEIHRPRIVVAENVPQFVTDWHMFNWWLDGWRHLGYRTQIVAVDAAHAGGSGNPVSPSWRPRSVMVASRLDVAAPDLDLCPPAWCASCRCEVAARQVWNRPGLRAGDYRKQYRYYCPRLTCRERVEPYTRAAADAFDLTDVGLPIRGREHEYAASTLVRLQAAIKYLGVGYARRLARPVAKEPIEGRYHCVIEWKNHADCASIHEPLTTIAAQGNHHGLVTAPDGWRPGMPLDVRDLHLRTITPAEQARAMRFPDTHVMCGNVTQRTSLAGNAVPVNLGRWVAERCREVLA